ncbi:hypothetical protein WA026_015208 [Henosepilachna vigintioctopunctata]|uniref:Glucose-methanol-choline oxidoreductase N-terminal domain-containing protein n=1 Tax=Henosepilachna vigintioctopunctata TaxID=420089 RepID=A0AAW1TKT3_9CUCU
MTAFGLYQHQEISCPNSVTGDAGIFFLALINTLFTNQCQLGNKDDYPIDSGPTLVDNEVFDYIIVGSGAAGSVVASELAKATQSRILLLEAGGYPSPTSDIPAFHPSLQKTTEDWQFHTEKSNESCLSFKFGRCLWPSGKTLGGSTTINHMLYVRGSKHSFNSWAAEGNLGWSYHEVLPYFKKLEKLEAYELKASKQYGMNGLLPLTRNRLHHPVRNVILDSVKEIGYKVYSHEGGLGFFEALQTIYQGVRKNAAKVFLADSRALPNLKVATEALVEKILIEKDLKEANGVVVNIAGRNLNIYAEKEVIISAGAVNSPKLLMLSGIGPKSHLGSLGIETIHDLNVGQTLKDHLTYPIITLTLNDSSVKYSSQNPTEELFKYFANREGILSNTGLSNILGYLNTKNHTGEPNVKFNYHIVLRQDSYAISQYRKNLNLDDTIIESIAEANKHSHILVISVTLLDAKSRGKIYLRSRNPHEKPLIHSGYLSDEKDLETLLKAIRIVEKQTETKAFKKLSAQLVNVDIPNCRKYKFRTDDYWRCAIRNVATSGHSPIATCKMGLVIDPDAVVDALLKVHGVGKLRVVDSSIIPSSTKADSAAVSLMIGQKGTQMILNGFSVIKHDSR